MSLVGGTNAYKQIVLRQHSEIQRLRARILDLEACGSSSSVKVIELERRIALLKSQTGRSEQVMRSGEVIDCQEQLSQVQRYKDELLNLAQRAKDKLDQQIANTKELRQERDDYAAKLRIEHKTGQANHDRAMALDTQVRALQAQLAEQQEQNRMLSLRAEKFVTLKSDYRKLLGQVTSLNQENSELRTKIERYKKESRRLQSDRERQAEELQGMRAKNQELAQSVADSKRLFREMKGDAAQKEEYKAKHTLVPRELAQAKDEVRQLSIQNEQSQAAFVAHTNIIETLSQELSRVEKTNNELKSLLLRLQAHVDAAHRRISDALGMADVSDKVLANLHRAVDSLQSSAEGQRPHVIFADDEPVVEKSGGKVDIEQVVKVKKDLSCFLSELTAISEEFTESSVEDWNKDLVSGSDAAPAKQKVEGGGPATSEDILKGLPYWRWPRDMVELKDFADGEEDWLS
jgi:chromosome segregation ATPase